MVVGAGFVGLEAATALAARGRVPVDDRLRGALPEVFVAGDTAAAAFDSEHTVMQACQHATPLGKVAGYNAAADLLDVPLRDFTPGPYVTCLDLGGAGAIFTRGWDRKVMASGADGAAAPWCVRGRPRTGSARACSPPSPVRPLTARHRQRGAGPGR